MNILIEGGNLNSIAEGTRNIAISYAKKFKEKGHNVVVLTKQIDRIRKKKYKEFEIIDGIKFYRWFNYEDKFYNRLVRDDKKIGRYLYNILRITSYYRYYSTYLKILKNEKIDIMNIFVKGLRPRVYLYFLKKSGNIPIILTLLGDPSFNYVKYNPKKEFSDIDLVIISSKTIYNHLKLFKIKNLKYLAYGIDTKKFKPKNREKNRKIKKIFCSRYYHSLGEVLKAFKKINKEIELEITFPEQTKKEINEEEFKDLPKKIKYLGYVKDIENTLSDMDLVIDLHREKKFLTCASPPAKILETMSSGTVVLSTNLPEIREVINDGENGFLVKINSSDEIYKKIKDIFSTKKDIGKEARKKIVKEFNIDKSVIDYENIYLKLSKNKNGTKKYS